MLGRQRVELLLVQSDEQCADLVSDFEATGLLNVAQIVVGVDQALACLRGHAPFHQPLEPALILIDLVSDDGSASLALDLELLSELKSDIHLRMIPVVVLTQEAAEADILNAYSNGACSFVTKPACPDERRRLIDCFARYWAQVAQLPKTLDRTCDDPWDEPAFSMIALDNGELVEPRSVEVLVVDDSEDDVILLREAFNECPLVNFVQTVEDGEDAMRYLRREGCYEHARRPSLVMLDINMPKMNGFEVLSQIRADQRLKNIPVVMLTTSKQESDILRAYSIGACSFIAKPVNFDKMRQIARQFTLYWTQVADLPPTDLALGVC